MSIREKLTNIADALRYVLGTNTTYTLAQMPSLIRQLSSNLKTDDIYYTLFEFDLSKYGQSLIVAMGVDGGKGTIKDTTPPNDDMIVSTFGTQVTSCGAYSNFHQRRLQSIFPEMVPYTTQDTYVNISNSNFSGYTFYAPFLYLTRNTDTVDNLVISQHYKFSYADTSKNYTNGIAINVSTNGNQLSSYADVDNQYFLKLLYTNIIDGKLRIYNGTYTQYTDICSVQPNTEYDVALDCVFTDNGLVQDNYSMQFDYSVVLTANGGSETYTGSIEFTFSDTFGLTTTKYPSYYRHYALMPRGQCPELLYWYSMSVRTIRVFNVLSSPLVTVCEDTFTNIDDNTAPGLTKIHEKSFDVYYASNLQWIDSSSVTEIGKNALYNSGLGSARNKLCNSIRVVNLPNVKTINEHGFDLNLPTGVSNNQNLDYCFTCIAKLNIPNVETIGSYGFAGALSACFEDINLPKLTSLGMCGFQNSAFTSFTAALLTKITSNSFQKCYHLRSVSLPECTVVDSYGFDSCYALTDINMPKLTTANSYAFAGLTYICKGRSLSLPALVTTDSYAFHKLNLGWTGTLSLPELTTAGGNAFENACIKTISLPKLVTSGSCFLNCCKGTTSISLPRFTGSAIPDNYSSGNVLGGLRYTLIEQLDLDTIAPSLTNYTANMLNYCSCAVVSSSLINTPTRYSCLLCFHSWINQVYFYSLPFLGGSDFKLCHTLELAYFGSLYTIGDATYYASDRNNHFYGCTMLQALILAGSESVCSLINTSAFTRSAISSVESTDAKAWVKGYIYVPKALLNDYKTAPNWVTFADRFRAIEDYGGLAGIRKLIYPDWTNTVSISNQSLYEQLTDTEKSSYASVGATITLSNTLEGVSLSDYIGDNDQYVMIRYVNNSLSNSSKLARVFLDLPPVKDFEFEFDYVGHSSGPIFDVGWKAKPNLETITSSEYANYNSPKGFGIGTQYVEFQYGLRINQQYNNAYRYDSDSYFYQQAYNTANAGQEYYDVLSDIDDVSRSSKYVKGLKIHFKIVRNGRFFKMYKDGNLCAYYHHDDCQNNPGGYIALTIYTLNATTARIFGLSNVTLKYNTQWYDTPNNEIWICSVYFDQLTLTLNSDTIALSKNDFGYFVIDTNELTDATELSSSVLTDGTNTYSVDLSSYTSNIIDVTSSGITVIA